MSSQKLKVMTVIGTRPEIIRLSRVMPLLDEYVNHIIVHTGQNYDYELNQIFFDEMELRKPDHFLNIDTSSLGSTVGEIIKKSEEVLKKEKPDALLVLGDTNSCLSAYIAKRMHIPVFHMEAGNRCFDENVPEETNRKIIDHIADFNLVYTEHARRHLISEGLPHRRIYLTGSPMKEVLDYYKPKIERSNILEQLRLTSNQQLKAKQRYRHGGTATSNFFLVSFHREENVDHEENLHKILTILNQLADEYKIPVIVSTHPRTQNHLHTLGDKKNHHSSLLTHHSLIQFHKPFGFPDYIKLQMNALCTLSDSGTISEESAILSFPAIIIRQSMERPETLDTGSVILSGLDSDVVMESLRIVTEAYKNDKKASIPQDYSINDTSWRVLKLITGAAKLSNTWSGVQRFGRFPLRPK